MPKPGCGPKGKPMSGAKASARKAALDAAFGMKKGGK